MKKNKTEKRISQFVPLEKCKPNQWNPNRMNKKEFEALKLSVKEHGQTKPIQVRPIKDGYEILGGYHTWLAMKELGFLEIEINSRKLNDDDAKIFSLQDNISGQDDIMRLGKLVYELTQKGYSIKKIAQVYGETEDNLKDALKVAQEEMDQKLKKLKEELNRENLVELAFIVDEKPKDQIKQFVKEITKFAETKGAEVESVKEKINPASESNKSSYREADKSGKSDEIKGIRADMRRLFSRSELQLIPHNSSKSCLKQKVQD